MASSKLTVLKASTDQQPLDHRHTGSQIDRAVDVHPVPSGSEG